MAIYDLQIEVYIVPNDKRASGIAEMGVPPVAPAIANTVYTAMGKRIRHIPIRAEDLQAWHRNRPAIAGRSCYVIARFV